MQAQKLKQGSLNFLKGENKINIVFDYSKTKIIGKTVRNKMSIHEFLTADFEAKIEGLEIDILDKESDGNMEKARQLELKRDSLILHKDLSSYWEQYNHRVYAQFIKDCNNELKDDHKLRFGNFPEAKYQATIKVFDITLNTNFNSGMGFSPMGLHEPDVDFEIVFTKLNKTEILAKITFNAEGNQFAWGFENRYITCVGEAGKIFGEFLSKKLRRLK
jgi:hypothetical protein